MVKGGLKFRAYLFPESLPADNFAKHTIFRFAAEGLHQGPMGRGYFRRAEIAAFFPVRGRLYTIAARTWSHTDLSFANGLHHSSQHNNIGGA